MRQGGCLCGAIRYEVEGEPLRSGTCHCRSCRKTASAPALPFAVFPVAAFRVTLGTPTRYRSSTPVTRSFCGQCGSPLTYQTTAAPDHLDVMTCSLDDPDSLAPALHVFTVEKLAWDVLCDGLPVYPSTVAAGPKPP
jgi:hypothetical protein